MGSTKKNQRTTTSVSPYKQADTLRHREAHKNREVCLQPARKRHIRYCCIHSSIKLERSENRENTLELHDHEDTILYGLRHSGLRYGWCWACEEDLKEVIITPLKIKIKCDIHPFVKLDHTQDWACPECHKEYLE